jgi:predicted GIY-YIG superfamily endonuclease
MFVVYLIHFDTPYKHARHYIGYTANLAARMAVHRSGHGARLLNACNQSGIAYDVVRTWSIRSRFCNRATALEHKLKRRKDSAALCPVCNKNWSATANFSDIVSGAIVQPQILIKR